MICGVMVKRVRVCMSRDGVLNLYRRRSFMRRRPVSKGKSARKFRGQVSKTKSRNMARPGRGGYRI